MDNRTNSSSENYYTAWVIFNETFLPLIVFVGLVGNLLAISLIQLNSFLRQLYSNVYLSAMATCSSIFLVTLFIMWIEPYAQFRVYSGSVIGCKIVTFLAHWADFSSVWLICVVCLDRVALLLMPERRLRIYDAVSPRKLTLLILSTIALGHSWLIICASIVPIDGMQECASGRQFHKVYQVFNLLETIFGVIVPFVVIAMSNLSILFSLRGFRKRDSVINRPATDSTPLENQESSASSDNNNGEAANEKCGVTATFLPNGQRQKSRREPSIQMKSLSSSERRTSPVNKSNKFLKAADMKLIRTLLCVTTIFVIMNVPSYMCRLFLPVIPRHNWEAWVWYFSYHIHYLHHAILFYLYIFVSRQLRGMLIPTFRNIRRKLCKRNKQAKVPIYV